MAICFHVNKRLFSTSRSVWSNVFNHVTIVGGGLMGSGIAQVTAQSGMDVTIIEVNEEAMKKSDANIKNSIQRVAKKLFQNSPQEAEKYIAESIGRLKISLDLNEAVQKTDLVVEAIVENINAKHRLFTRIDPVAPEHTIFASNTSSLSITDIASVTGRKDRFGGLHFFNPVPVMKLLEVIRTNDTSEDTYQKMMAWGKAIGKTTITCKDTPGFVVNRLLIPYLAEAVRMLERSDASAKDIDIAMKLGAGYPMGPLELLDYVGLDTTKFILDGWHSKYPENPLFQPIPLLQKLVSENKLGKKSGEGFYNYKKQTGSVTPFLHSPFFQPLPNSSSPPNSVYIAPDVNQAKGAAKPEKIKPRVKTEKLAFKPIPDSQRAEAPPKMVNAAKSKRAEKIKNLEKWKNSEEFLKFERGKTTTATKKGPKAKRPKPCEQVLVPRDPLRTGEKSKNLEEFIRFERNRDFGKLQDQYP